MKIREGFVGLNPLGLGCVLEWNVVEVKLKISLKSMKNSWKRWKIENDWRSVLRIIGVDGAILEEIYQKQADKLEDVLKN